MTNLKTLRDTAHQQMQLAKRLGDSESFKMFKAIYSKLCADYFDQQHKETQ
jgi:hypothetical protein